MKFGVCIDYTRAQMVKDLGFDYIEPMLSVVANYSEEEFQLCKNTLEALNLKAECFNALFFGDVKIIGKGVDYSIIKAYLDKAFTRAKTLGAKVVVFGSGKARSTQDGLLKEDVLNQLAGIFGFVGDVAKSYGITIVVEPLCSSETDIINTVAEGLDFIKRVNHQNVKCLADMYHVACSGETLEAIETAGELLHHVHVTDVEELTKPSKLKLLKAALDKCGYNARISIEYKQNHDPSLREFSKNLKERLKIFKKQLKPTPILAWVYCLTFTNLRI